MPDDTALVTAYLADRHVLCPACGYDLCGAADGRCSECGEAVTLHVERPQISRLHEIVLITLAIYLAAIGTAHAAERWIMTYDNFVKPQAFATSPASTGWSTLPIVVLTSPVLATAVAMAAWMGLAWIVLKRPFDRKRLPTVTALAVFILAAMAIARLAVGVSGVFSRL